MKFLFKYLRDVKPFIAVALTLKVVATLVELAIPYILSHILDNVVKEQSIKTIVFWGIAMIGCAAFACVGNITANRMVGRVARNSTKRIRHDLFVRTMHLSSKQIDEFTIPSLESRLTSDTYHVHNFTAMGMRMGVRAPILLIGGLFVTATLDLALTLVMALILPLITLTIYFVSRKGIPLFRKIQKSLDGMTRIVREDAQGIRVIKALSKVDYEKRRYDSANKALVADGIAANSTMAASNPIVTLLLNFGLVSVIVVGAFRVNAALGSPGTIIAFIQYFTMISMAMRGLARIFIGYTRCSASAQRIEEVINTPYDLEVESEDKYPRTNDDNAISFENVSFSFVWKKNTVSNISFSIKKGQSLGIIGATGSGKTTLLQLLLRFYDVGSGNIRINGQDIRTIPHDELNAKFGVVMQNDFVFAGSIKDNIVFHRDIDDEAVKKAARIAQAAEFIECYDDGYDHMLNSKGTNLSGGQRQRLLITRAVAGNPDILVLDDSSSALDYKTDAKLRRALREELSDLTTVIIAQRVSSVKYCDLIIVLEDGKIIGKGTHDELLASCDVYKEISDSQIGGAFVD